MNTNLSVSDIKGRQMIGLNLKFFIKWAWAHEDICVGSKESVPKRIGTSQNPERRDL